MIIIKNQKVRRIFKILIPFIIIPFILFCGIYFGNEKKYFITSVIVALLSVVLFLSGIEKRNLGERRMVIVSVMTALCIVGRFIPFFQPITAFTVITAVYIGGESGFLVGSMAAFLSNFYFGQGPWTPFQMLAWGMIGLFAGYLSNILSKSKWLMILYGVLSGFAYSLVMDVWSTLWFSGTFNKDLYFAAFITALPHTMLYVFSNFIFLYICSEPFGKKFRRIKLKYGI